MTEVLSPAANAKADYAGRGLLLCSACHATGAAGSPKLGDSGAWSARIRTGVPTGVLIAEGLHQNKAHRNGKGINTLTNATPAPPFGGAAFHDAAVWIRRAD